MMICCCGTCLYSTNKQKYSDNTHVECMVDSYSKKHVTQKCSSYKRDFNKRIQVVSNVSNTR